MKTEIDGHLYALMREMLNVIDEAHTVAEDCLTGRLDTVESRTYCRTTFRAIDARVENARRHLDLYASSEADKDAALDGAAEGVRKAIQP